MTAEHPATALTREHREIDAALEEFVALLQRDELEPRLALDAAEELRRHIYLEEAFLFPPLLRGGLLMPITVMLREHGELWRLTDTLADLAATAQTTADRQALLGLGLDLLARLSTHNYKEEPVVYPQTDALLSTEESEQLAAAIADDVLPAGWACRYAVEGSEASPLP